MVFSQELENMNLRESLEDLRGTLLFAILWCAVFLCLTVTFSVALEAEREKRKSLEALVTRQAADLSRALHAHKVSKLDLAGFTSFSMDTDQGVMWCAWQK